jgi:hypothetical protein
LVNVNEQVLSLIERYPELEVTTGEYGQLSISEDSWESVIAKQNAIITNYSNAQ